MKYSDEELIAGCLRNSAKHQEALYKQYGSRMMALCVRYARTSFEAEDIFQEAWVKVFRYLPTYEGKGSFEGWVRHVFVNTAINHYNQNKRFQNHVDEAEVFDMASADSDAVSKMTTDELLQLIQQLPAGYRVIFNLYVIEGYAHREIAEMLGINEGTSKSQLSKAKAILKKIILTQTVHRDVV